MIRNLSTISTGGFTMTKKWELQKRYFDYLVKNKLPLDSFRFVFEEIEELDESVVDFVMETSDEVFIKNLCIATCDALRGKKNEALFSLATYTLANEVQAFYYEAVMCDRALAKSPNYLTAVGLLPYMESDSRLEDYVDVATCEDVINLDSNDYANALTDIALNPSESYSRRRKWYYICGEDAY